MPSLIDTMQGQLPPILKWCLAGMGGVAGFVYAQQHGSPIRASCIVAGATAGFCLIVGLFAGLRVVKMLVVLAVLLVILNYVFLIPYGYGDHLPDWIEDAQIAAGRLVGWVARLSEHWGRNMR